MSFSEEMDHRQAEFLTLLMSLGSVTLAARELGLNRNTAFTWARKAGFRVKSYPARAHPGREEFAKLRADGLSRRDAVSTTPEFEADATGESEATASSF